MALYLACGNQKGGVGKTTLVTSLAGEWAKRGKRVLVVDLDPQGHATLWLREKNDGGRVVDALIARQSLTRCILRSKHARLDVLPGGERLVALNLHLVVEMVVGLIRDPLLAHMAEHLRLPGVPPELVPSIQEQVAITLREAIRTEAADLDRAVDLRAALRAPAIAETYDVVLLDCGPTATNLLGEALRAADQALCVSVPSGLGADGTSQYLATIASIQEQANPDLRVAGIVLNNHHRERSETEYVQAFRDTWPDLLLQTVVPHDALLMRASSGVRLNAISFYARKARITRIIAELADEVLSRLGVPA